MTRGKKYTNPDSEEYGFYLTAKEAIDADPELEMESCIFNIELNKKGIMKALTDAFDQGVEFGRLIR